MNITVVLEPRFVRTPEGQIWTDGVYGDSYWRPHLAVFNGVEVVARVMDAAEPPSNWVRITDDRIAFRNVPYYLGPLQYLKQLTLVRRAIREATSESNSALLLRVPSNLANHVRLSKVGRPYAVEVAGDPSDVFSRGSINHPLRPFLRQYFVRKMREQCAHASVASYVTQYTLQKKYPVREGILSVGVSSIQIPENLYSNVPRQSGQQQRWSLIYVGTLDQLYKAPDVLLSSLASLYNQGMQIALTFVGDGKYRPRLEQQARELGVADSVRFLGHVSDREVLIRELDDADLFVLPSRTEGLPRAMIEAMARGLPCIGSYAGGIPELLLPEDLVPPGDTAALSDKIRTVLCDESQLRRMSERNLAKAKEFSLDLLMQRREAFYQALLNVTEQWLWSSGRSTSV